MTIKMLTGNHLTASDKRDIAAIIANGWTFGKTKIKSYTVTLIEGAVYSVKLVKSEKDDWGRPSPRTSHFTVEVA